MRVLGLLKEISPHTSSYPFHVWYMIQHFHRYAQCCSCDDCTTSHQTVLNSSYIYHKWLRNLGPTGIFLGMN